MNTITLSDKEKKELAIMNSIAGFNPTGQMQLKNGVFIPQGNPAQVVSVSTLQKESLQSAQNNTLNPQTTSQVAIKETFINNNTNNNNKELILLIILIIMTLYIIMSKY